jgi:hypothetical protein
MSLYQPKGLIIPRHIIKERIDEVERRDWEDPDRYVRIKAQALKYIPVRAREVTDVDRLMREVARTFHDDLLHDKEVREFAEQEIYRHSHIEAAILAAAEKPSKERGEVRGVEDTEECHENLSWQLEEEIKTP